MVKGHASFDEFIKATSSNCGKFLRTLTTADLYKYKLQHQGNDLGDGKNVKDWTIRSELSLYKEICSTTTKEMGF